MKQKMAIGGLAIVMLAWVAAAPAAAPEGGGPSSAGKGVLSVRGDQFLLDGRPFDMWGIRVASGTKDQALTGHLIAQLEDYRAHGVNAITAFYQGCRGGNYDPFSPDGTRVDDGHQRRMEQILDACRRRDMAVVVGIFYQAAPFGLKDAGAVRAAVRTVTEKLRPWRNLIINIANEQNSGEWKKHAAVYDFTDPANVLALCRLVHEVDKDRLVGGGGYDPARSIAIGKSADCDVLLFDTSGPQDSGQLYERFVKAGVADKPVVNVETFGGWTKKFERGVFSEEVRKAYQSEVDAAARIGGLYLFFHNNPWCQNHDGPMRFDFGGAGTKESPGIRWYFEYVKKKRAAGRAAAP